jgi:hypothetical protein
MAIETVDPALVASVNSAATAMAPALVLGLGVAVCARTWRRSSGLTAWSLGLAALAGLALGAAAVAGGPLAPVLDARRIFAVGSPWDLSGVALVAQRFPEALRALGEVLRTPLAMLPHPIKWMIRAFVVFGSAAIVLPFIGQNAGPAAVTAAKGIAIAAVTLVAVIYLACFGPWLLNLLNFWALALLLALFVYWRHGTL